MKQTSRVYVALAALALSACATASSSRFQSNAFQHPVHPYRVMNEQGATLLASNEWYVDNYRLDERGQPAEPKSGPNYEHVLKLDSDGDGVVDTSEKVASYDLLLRSRKTDARIWLRSPPVGTDLRETELRILARKYIDSISDGGSVLVDLKGGKIQIEPRYATRLVSVAEATLDGHAAFEATFDVATVDQAQLDPKSASERARVVFVRPKFHYRADGVDFPVLLIIGYSNRPEDFERELPAFERLLGRVQLMSEGDTLASASRAIFECKPEARKLAVVVTVDASGSVEWGGVHAPGEPRPERPADDVAQLPSCIDNALDVLRFEPTGAERSLSFSIESGAKERAPKGYVRAPSQDAPATSEPAPGQPAPVEL